MSDPATLSFELDDGGRALAGMGNAAGDYGYWTLTP